MCCPALTFNFCRLIFSIRCLHSLIPSNHDVVWQFNISIACRCTRGKHLIPKWPPTVKSWGELHENGVIRAKCVCSVNKMPQNCSVLNCTKKVYREEDLKISFHKFPKHKDPLATWIRAVRRAVGRHFAHEGLLETLQGFRFSEHTRWQKNTSSYRCSFHFFVEERFS